MKIFALPIVITAALLARMGAIDFKLEVHADRTGLVASVERGDRSAYALVVDNEGVRVKHSGTAPSGVATARKSAKN